jgi:hypothetical protein
MRLTLRTLLAYLDDTLEPAQAKAIGQKIAESATAQEIIARIKEVVRRRRLTVPPATGPAAKLDPNTVAEYIDSVLPADQLSQVEEVCLESDVFLAEVAACHQILTVVLSEPSLVPPTARQRMYGLVQGPEAAPYRRAAAPLAHDEEATSASARRDEADEALLMGLPLYRAQGPWFRRLAPVAGVLLLVAALVAALWIGLSPSTIKEQKPREVTMAKGNTPADVKPPEVKAAEKTPVEVEPKAPAKSPDAKEPAKPPVKGSDATPAKPSDSNPPKPADPPRSPVESEPKPAGKPPASAEVKPPEVGPRNVVGKYLSPATAEANVLLDRQADKGPWKRLIHNSPVYSEDSLVSLPGYQSKIHFDRGVDLTLWGDLPEGADAPIFESAAILHDSPDVDLDVTLDHGRIGIANTKPAGTAEVRVRFYKESWMLTLEPGSDAAMELWGRYTPDQAFSKDPNRDEVPHSYLGLFVLKGKVNLKIANVTHYLAEPRGPAMLVWQNGIGPDPGPRNREAPPSWAKKTAPRGQALKMNQVLKNLSLRLNRQVEVDVVLPEMIKDQDANTVILGMYCLGAVSDLPNLLEALADEHSPPGARQVAVDVLQFWIGQRPERDLKLYKELEGKYSAVPAEIIMDLLHGFSQARWSQPETYETLIEYLKNDKLPIREMAFRLLVRNPATTKIAERSNYDPAGDSEQRLNAYRVFKKLIPDGELPPKTLPPETPKKKP